MFKLDERLQQDTRRIGGFALCEVLLMNDASYPWVILVPRKADVTELYQLSVEEQQLFIGESSFVAQLMNVHFQAHKINVAALGNVVQQLHIHHIVRYHHDAAWPRPVWGVKAAEPYSEIDLESRINSLQALFSERWVD